MRICVIASSRFPIREPFQGGLEAHTASLASGLTRRGHEVTVFAAPGSDTRYTTHYLDVEPFVPSDGARSDVGASPDSWMREHHAYLGLMLDLSRGGHRFDVVHNNSLHHLPIAMAGAVDLPVVTSLHTPPVAWLESAIGLARGRVAFSAVSAAVATAWQHACDASVIRNGIDTDRWRAGPGGGPAVWTGRLVPEKAPHLAIDAARAAGHELVLAGPAPDPTYLREQVEPRLGADARWLGHLDSGELVDLVGRASVAVVSPAWEEPFGLVAAEAMSCGTPVAALARGGLVEVVTPTSGALASSAGDESAQVAALAAAVGRAALLDRDAVRAHAVAHLGVEAMLDGYEALYADLRDGRDTPATAA